MAESADETGHRFAIRILIKHPHANPEDITARLGLSPNLSQRVGEQRRTPVGTVLEGVYRQSVWSWWSRVYDLRFFSREVATLLDRIEPSAEFLCSLVDEGGSVDIIVGLPGDINIGDVFEWRQMARMALLKTNLGIEVFPEFNSIVPDLVSIRALFGSRVNLELGGIEALDAITGYT